MVAVAGHPKERSTFYFGSTGGGVWCTTDAGITWCNLSDGFFHRAAVGAIALAPSGTERDLRGYESPGQRDFAIMPNW